MRRVCERAGLQGAEGTYRLTDHSAIRHNEAARPAFPGGGLWLASSCNGSIGRALNMAVTIVILLFYGYRGTGLSGET